MGNDALDIDVLILRWTPQLEQDKSAGPGSKYHIRNC